MALTPSQEVVPNYGMGLITYICDEVGPAHKDGETPAQSIENLVKLPLGTKLYLRVNWKDVQQRPGGLTLRPTGGLGQQDETGGVPSTSG